MQVTSELPESVLYAYAWNGSTQRISVSTSFSTGNQPIPQQIRVTEKRMNGGKIVTFPGILLERHYR
jgi:hypothetical protein